MRYIYVAVGLVFIGLGILHFVFKTELLIQPRCSICSALSQKEHALVNIRKPSSPIVDGHYILFTHRRLSSIDEFSNEEKESLLSLLGSIEKRYLKEFGLIGHSQSLSSSTSGHLFMDVIPKKGVGYYLFFQLNRLIRNLTVKSGNLFLDTQNLVLDTMESNEAS